jgi:phenylalanine-4-hydroxylase
MLVHRPFHIFTPDDDLTWSMLYQRQVALMRQHATEWYLQGFETLNFPTDRVPDAIELNQKVHVATGWHLVSTDVQYSSDQDWFEALDRKEFLITEYIRDRADIDYTPMPDIWHDLFGHLPFMTIPRYANYLQRFGTHFLKYSTAKRDSLRSLWWYSVEFGLLRDGDQLRALGAGLMSSYAELTRVYDGHVNLQPYSLEAFESIAPSPHEMHNTLFIFDTWEQIEQSIEDWVAKHPSDL